MAKYKVELNSTSNLRQLLQETYQLADEQLIQAQREITKLSNATNLQDEIMDGKQKYAKAINDYLSIKDKAIGKKLDIAKMLSEIIKHNGNVENALNDSQATKNSSINFDKIKALINSQTNMDEDDEPKNEKIRLKNH